MRKLIFLLLLSAAAFAQQPMAPPPGWWHDPYLSENVKLTSEQVVKLDGLQNSAKDDARQLDRDVRKAEDELRAALNDRNANVDRIVSAGNRVATLRDQMLRKQIVMLANQRAILTQAQWSALQKQLEERGGPAMGDRERGGFGPRGGGRPPRGGGMRPPA